jgi:hypothetical protein
LSDIYSLGVTLFEMVTGKCPYQEITNLFELQSKIVNEPLPPTRKYYPDVTLKIQEAIKIATNKNPEQRFKNCNEFKSYLLEIEKPHPDPVQKPTQQKQTQRQHPIAQQSKPGARRPQPIKSEQLIEEKNKSTRWIYLAVVVSVLIIGGITYLSLNQSNSHPHQTNITLTSPPVKPTVTSGSNTKLHDKPNGSMVVKTSKAENKTNTQILPEPTTTKTDGRRNPLPSRVPIIREPRRPTVKAPPAAFQNVKDDLMRYLGGRKSFGGVEYKDISEITVGSVSDKGTDEVGNRGYDINITINGEDLTCQVIYTSNDGKPLIKALKQ